MKKITLVSAVAAAAFAATAAFSATSVFADDTTPTKTQSTTDAKINLTVDGKDGLNGITLDKAPAIDFGNPNLEVSGKEYDATSITDLLQVTNPGVDQGWTVQVASSAFKSDKNTLKGAVLTFDKGTVSNGEGNQSAVATPNSVSLSSTDSVKANILTAANGQAGVGVTTEKFAAADKTADTKGDVHLNVPAGNVAGNYTAHLTWTLTDSVQ